MNVFTLGLQCCVAVTEENPTVVEFRMRDGSINRWDTGIHIVNYHYDFLTGVHVIQSPFEFCIFNSKFERCDVKPRNFRNYVDVHNGSIVYNGRTIGNPLAPKKIKKVELVYEAIQITYVDGNVKYIDRFGTPMNNEVIEKIKGEKNAYLVVSARLIIPASISSNPKSD